MWMSLSTFNNEVGIFVEFFKLDIFLYLITKWLLAVPLKCQVLGVILVTLWNWEKICVLHITNQKLLSHYKIEQKTKSNNFGIKDIEYMYKGWTETKNLIQGQSAWKSTLLG